MARGVKLETFTGQGAGRHFALNPVADNNAQAVYTVEREECGIQQCLTM
jgi:hypothetical protein